MAEIKSYDEDIVVLLNWVAQAMTSARYRQVIEMGANEIIRLRGKLGLPSHGDNWRSELKDE